MSTARKVFAVAVLAALVWAVPPTTEAQPPIRTVAGSLLAAPLAAEAQPPIRIGASPSLTGIYAAIGQSLHREAIRRAGSLDSGKVRDAILKMDHSTVFGGFRVDRDGLQVAHKALMFQWQDGKKVIVWPEELAALKARFPTPPWSQRP